MRLSDLIAYYSKPGIASEIIRYSEGREVALQFDEIHGKRPDTLQFPKEITDAARRGMTSIHCSQELWRDPLLLSSESTKKDMDDLRAGWDFIIDIDCKLLEWSKICAQLLVESLKYHDVKCISLKFSGGTGWHLGIPGIALSDEKLAFPETPQAIVGYLKEFIRAHLADRILKFEGDIKTIIEKSKKTKEALYSGKQSAPDSAPVVYEDKGFGTFVQRKDLSESKLYEKKEEFSRNLQFDPFSVLGLDIIAIAPRHLIRAPYSINEKRWRVSLPIKPEELPEFTIEKAELKNVTEVKVKFLSHDVAPGEASQLLVQAMDWQARQTLMADKKKTKTDGLAFEFSETVPKEQFPPCMKCIYGLADGRKRALFAYMNFLKSAKWDWAEIEAELREWNSKNSGPLKEGYLRAQLNWHKRQAEKIPPPNCRDYYKDIGICRPDHICERIKNPISYPRFLQGRQHSQEKQK
ncbi:MAG: hypothetical protein AABX75_01670 [Nanoarchaeota archaeon]